MLLERFQIHSAIIATFQNSEVKNTLVFCNIFSIFSWNCKNICKDFGKQSWVMYLDKLRVIRQKWQADIISLLAYSVWSEKTLEEITATDKPD